MAIPRPKILTRFTVPTGGWAFDIDVSSAGGGPYDISITGTVPAGDYYIAWDHQADDFLSKFEDVVNAAIDSEGTYSDSGVIAFINSDHTISLSFEEAFTDGDELAGVRLNWPNMTEIAAVLGFDSSAADSSLEDNPLFTGDYHHAYGWYVDEDGLLGNDFVEDVDMPKVSQSRSISGHVKTQYFGSVYSNEMNLQFISRAKMFSNEVDYTDTPVHPYSRNEGLECWFREARQGTPFRVYRYNQIDTSLAAETGTRTASTSTSMTDSNKSWEIDPQRWLGRLLYIADFTTESRPGRWYISANTATVLTVGDNYLNYNVGNGAVSYHIFDQTYETYWLDQNSMTSFHPEEIPKIDRYNITLPLLKYVS